MNAICSTQEIEPLMLVALQKVPQLTYACLERGSLSELRSTCKAARQEALIHASGLIRGITVDLEKPFTAHHSQDLRSLLDATNLSRLCVVFDLANEGRLGQDVSRLSKYLHDSSSSVTRVHIKMRCNRPYPASSTSLPPAADTLVYAIHTIFNKCCTSLTHITVTCELFLMGEGEGVYAPILGAAMQLAGDTLTHFSYRVPYKFRCQGDMHPLPNFGGDTEEEIEIYELDDRAGYALIDLYRMTHLDLGHGFISRRFVWRSLPNCLQSLSLLASYNTPSNILLPNLSELTLTHSRCHDLLNLLNACPNLRTLNLAKLFVPTTNKEQAALGPLMVHPMWIHNGSGDSHCTPVTELHTYVESFVEHPIEDDADNDLEFLAPHKVMVALPAMPAITNFRFDFSAAERYDYDGKQVHEPAPTSRLLHHIPRALPNLTIMRLDHVPLLDSDLTQLYECTPLIKLDIRSSEHVTGHALLLLARALPKLAYLYVTACKLVHRHHKKAINQLMKKRGGRGW